MNNINYIIVFSLVFLFAVDGEWTILYLLALSKTNPDANKQTTHGIDRWIFIDLNVLLNTHLYLSLQTTASECTFVTLLAARSDAMRRYRTDNKDLEDAEINARLVAYCSDQVGKDWLFFSLFWYKRLFHYLILKTLK